MSEFYDLRDGNVMGEKQVLKDGDDFPKKKKKSLRDILEGKTSPRPATPDDPIGEGEMGEMEEMEETAPPRRPSMKLGMEGKLGETRTLYSPNRKLKIADRLRKRGYGRAAEALALEYGRSAEGMAPAVSNRAMRDKLAEDSARASKMRKSNQELADLLMEKSRKRLLKGVKSNKDIQE